MENQSNEKFIDKLNKITTQILEYDSTTEDWTIYIRLNGAAIALIVHFFGVFIGLCIGIWIGSKIF